MIVATRWKLPVCAASILVLASGRAAAQEPVEQPVAGAAATSPRQFMADRALALAAGSGWRIKHRWEAAGKAGNFFDVAYANSEYKSVSGRRVFAVGMAFFSLGTILMIIGGAINASAEELDGFGLIIGGAIPAAPGLLLWIPGLARWQIHDRRLRQLDAIELEAENYRQSARLRVRGFTPSVMPATRSLGLNLTLEF